MKLYSDVTCDLCVSLNGQFNYLFKRLRTVATGGVRYYVHGTTLHSVIRKQLYESEFIYSAQIAVIPCKHVTIQLLK